jgi:hypothetical protein
MLPPLTMALTENSQPLTPQVRYLILSNFRTLITDNDTVCSIRIFITLCRAYDTRWSSPTAIKSMTFLQRRRPPTRSLIPFRTNYITMRRRMLGSVFDIGTFYAGPHSSMCIPLQVAPAPGHGQPEGYREDIPPPLAVGGVAGPGRVYDPHRIDMAYQGIVDYHPRPLVVSIFHLTATEPPYR